MLSTLFSVDVGESIRGLLLLMAHKALRLPLESPPNAFGLHHRLLRLRSPFANKMIPLQAFESPRGGEEEALCSHVSR